MSSEHHDFEDSLANYHREQQEILFWEEKKLADKNKAAALKEMERIDKINAINRQYGAEQLAGGTVFEPEKFTSDRKWDDRWWKRFLVSIFVASMLALIFDSIFKSQTNTAIFFNSSIQLAVLIYFNVYKITKNI
jgi:hypothetical protein